MNGCVAFIREFRWKMFAICAFAEAFRRAYRQNNTESWRELMQTMEDNRRSIEIFARVRSLEWRGQLLKYTNHDMPFLRQALEPKVNLTNEHPRLLVHSTDGQLRRPMANGKLQSHAEAFRCLKMARSG